MDRFEQLLLDHQNDQLAVVDPSGGKGDELIYLGLEKKLKQLRLDFKTINYVCENSRDYTIRRFLSKSHLPKNTQLYLVQFMPSFSTNLTLRKLSKMPKCKTVIVRGGAYLDDLWGDYDVLNFVVENGPDTIILSPMSFSSDKLRLKDELNHISKEVHLFCRDEYSLSLLSSWQLRKNIHLYLSHDTALYLSKNDLINYLNSSNKKYDLICNRQDKERVVNWNLEKLKSKQSKDSSGHRFLVGDLDAVRDFKTWVKLISGASKVFTDRLHVGVLSTILGIDTFLFPNSYYKNKGVYEYSLSKFPNAHFIDSRTFDPFQFYR